MSITVHSFPGPLRSSPQAAAAPGFGVSIRLGHPMRSPGTPSRPGVWRFHPMETRWPPAAMTRASGRRSSFGIVPPGCCLAGWQGHHTATVSSLAFSPDGRILASSSLDSGEPAHPNVSLWDVASRAWLANLAGHDGSVRSVAFSPDGALLATAGDDMIVRLWDTKLRTCKATLRGHTRPVNSVAWSALGQTLVSGSCDSTARIWKAPGFELSATLNHSGNVNAVAFSPGRLASGCCR